MWKFLYLSFTPKGFFEKENTKIIKYETTLYPTIRCCLSTRFPPPLAWRWEEGRNKTGERLSKGTISSLSEFSRNNFLYLLSYTSFYNTLHFTTPLLIWTRLWQFQEPKVKGKNK